MKIFGVLLVVVVVADGSPTVFEHNDLDWETFKLRFNKSYSTSVEESIRRKIFTKSLKEISEHNENFKRGLTTFSMKIGRFSDLLPHEFESMLSPITDFPQPTKNAAHDETFNLEMELPENVDWRVEGAVTPVKDQHVCGACWAFSATGGLEGQLFLKTGRLVSLSEQNLVDCSKKTNACHGGNLPDAFEYSARHGLESEDSYPYENRNSTCRFDATKVVVRNRGFHHVRSGSEEDLKKLVATSGPVSVCIDTRRSFDQYGGGIYYENNCSTTRSNHCVLVVGYGTTDDGQDYWLVKNSWGSEHFGENGYIRMARNRDNMCAIATFAYLPLL